MQDRAKVVSQISNYIRQKVDKQKKLQQTLASASMQQQNQTMMMKNSTMPMMMPMGMMGGGYPMGMFPGPRTAPPRPAAGVPQSRREEPSRDPDYGAVWKSIQIPLAIASLDFVILDSNDRFAMAMGRQNPGELRNSSLFDFCHMDSRAQDQQRLQQRVQGGGRAEDTVHGAPVDHLGFIRIADSFCEDAVMSLTLTRNHSRKLVCVSLVCDSHHIMPSKSAARKKL